MALGRKTGGRKKGTPNKVTTATRETLQAAFEELAPDFVAVMRAAKEAEPTEFASLYLRLAEFSVPKLARTEVTGESGEAISIEIVRTVAAGTSKD